MASFSKTLRARAKAIPGAQSLWHALRSTLHPHERAVRRVRKLSPDLLLQPSHYTSFDRYPWLFKFLGGKLSDQKAPRVLSYGCATGEELFSLKAYLPDATLVGIDINPRNIAICNRKSAKSGAKSDMQFRCAGSPAGEASESYDAILCLAVLRHGALQDHMPDDCAPWIDFAAVDQMVTELARCVKPGGYLAIWHSHFRFADMSVAAQFRPVLSHKRSGRESTPFYGSDNRRLNGVDYSDAVFQKLA
jgi:2-polyprenyl-3-methyl-5-hydroxy-6-metoxy-1,4-benzoquinol methylase